MNSTLRDAQALSHRECLLPSMSRTPSVTQVTPAKKITFLKRGDPRFAGVRLAVDQRAFKSFGALMDELSQRVPLSFGVRSVTTPRGLHGLSALEQLEDGGCYLCSDKKPPKTPSRPGWSQWRSPSTQQSRDFESRCEAPGTSSSCKGPKAPRKIMLVKNGDPRFQQTLVLSHRNTRNMTAFLSKASDLLHFPVKQVYTTSGKKVDSSLEFLVTSPPLTVFPLFSYFHCVSGSWGPKAKQSVIHSRSRSGSRSQRFSLLSERSGLSDPPVSLHHAQMDPAHDGHPQNIPAQLGPLVASDDVEKNIRMNEDGSLSVEMKVRFHLLGEDALLWSRRVGRANALTAASEEVPVLGEVGSLHCVWEDHAGGSSEPKTQGPCEAGCEEACGQGLWQPGSRYEIWMNPLYSTQGEEMASRRRTRLTQHSHSRRPCSKGFTRRKRSSKDNVSPASSDRPPKDSESTPSCCSRSPEGSVGSCDLHSASGAASQRGAGWETDGPSRTREAPGQQGAGHGSREHHSCLKPQTRGTVGALSDSSGSAGSHEQSSERSEQHQGFQSKTRAMTTSRTKATQGEGPSLPMVSPLSLRNEDSQAEENGQVTRSTQAEGRFGMRLPLAPGPSGSGDTAEGSSPPSACTSVPGKRRKKGRASALSSPSISGLSRGAQIGCPSQHHTRRHTYCPPDSPMPRQMPGPPGRGRASPNGPAPPLSASSPSTRNHASQDTGSPFSASLHSQYAQGVSSALITPASNSDCTSNFYSPYPPSAEAEVDPEFRACSSAPTPSNTSDSLSNQADGLDKKAGGSIPKSSWPLVLPVGQPDTGMPGAHQGCSCSSISTCLFHRTPSCTSHALQTSQPLGSLGPFSEVSLACSRYCPTPPRTWPFVKKHPSCNSSPRADCSCGPRSGRIYQGKKVTDRGESLEGQEKDGRMVLGALPQASPDAVVREWLSNIPEEPIPMKCEMVDESTDVAGDDPESPKEDPVDQHSPECLGEPTQVRQLSHEGATSEKAEPGEAFPVTGDADTKSGEGLPCNGVSEDSKEAGAGKGMAADCRVGQCVLPHKVSASIQIMKVLMGSKQGRPSSLPEVSNTVGRRLSYSSQALITCLAGLHFFDEDLGPPTGKVRFVDSPRYQELLSTFQALWPGCDLRRGELDLGLWELGWRQALPGLRSDIMTEDFTPTSSSGVDVHSGSGGSGEGSGPCVMECALVPEKIALPLKIPSQRSDSRNSESQEDQGNQQPSGSTASSNSQAWTCASRKDETERNSRAQVLGHNLDQEVENTVQDEEALLEKVGEEKEIAALQGEGVQGFPEEERVIGQEMSEANFQDGEGAREVKSGQEEEAGGDPASTLLCPPGEREKPTELPRSLSERDPNTSGPQMEHGLEKLPKAAELCHVQTQAKHTQGPGERSSSRARRVSLDPDALWVSRLLRKMEKAFMAHLASATAELRARWSLQNDRLLDQMVAELQQDLDWRLRESTENELRKIQSRAGGKTPAREALRWELSLQTEQRRRRLQGLRHLSAFSGQAGSQGPSSFPMEEDASTLSGTLRGTWLVGEPEGEEFCPCEACMRKKVIPMSPKDTTGAPRAPIKKAFDLQHILQKKKGGCASGEAVDPLGTGTIEVRLGLGQDPGPEEQDEGESSQTLGRDGDCRGEEEEATAQKREGITGADRGSVPEGAGRDDPSLGGQDDGVKTPETREAEGEGQSELGGGNQGEKEGSPEASSRQGQLAETSGNSSPDQEGEPALPSSPGGDSPCQRSGWKAGLSSSNISSLGDCSQLSQKGSEEKPLSRDMRSTEEESKGVPGSERKVTGVYPEISASEQEGAPSGPRTPEHVAGKTSGLEVEKVVKTPAFTEMRFKNFTMDRTDAFGQEDLDF
uniref:Doublecortin domain-containing protein n=1 Tax=Neovison vison TaxID=452646 RepID=A0A8C7EVY1_NEOVI